MGSKVAKAGPLLDPTATLFLTESAMRERLVDLGHRPEFGCELLGFDQDGNGVTTRLVSEAGEDA
jgi:hypothetical protein